MPEFILQRVLRSAFYNIYSRHIQPQLKDQKLSRLLKGSYLARKPIMFIISE